MFNMYLSGNPLALTYLLTIYMHLFARYCPAKPNFNSVVDFPYTAESYEASELKDFHTQLSHMRLLS